MNTKKEYIVPQLTVVNMKVERGYASSNILQTLGLIQMMDHQDLNYNSQNQQIWTESDAFGSW